MNRFAELFARLDATNKTREKVTALVDYFRSVPAADAAWAIALLMGRKPRFGINSRQIRTWAAEAAGIPHWLFEESYQMVGDLAETVSLLLPESSGGEPLPLHDWAEKRLPTLQRMTEEERRHALTGWWLELPQRERFVLTKLLTGGWRVGVSQRLLTSALATVLGSPVDTVAHRLMGKWEPSASFYERLGTMESLEGSEMRPYPFFLAYPLDVPVEELGPPEDWHVEWKWDGIRAQVLNRGGRIAVWSRGEELVTGQFPEIEEAARNLSSDAVLDGEILAWRGGVLPFSLLQRRLGRKQVSRKLRTEVPVAFLAFDLLELDGADLRDTPFIERRRRLEAVVAPMADGSPIALSPRVQADHWEGYRELQLQSRGRGVEGFMLKRLNSTYEVGRKRGGWWKWKVSPYTVDAVLIYAERGHGRRAGLYTDYTLAVWDGDVLVPFAKAYSGLSDAEIREVDGFIRRNTTERFGPVRSVQPALVMEVAFESIGLSKRHKAGVAVRFPRIVRWRRDKSPADADSLETLRGLLSPADRP